MSRIDDFLTRDGDRFIIGNFCGSGEIHDPHICAFLNNPEYLEWLLASERALTPRQKFFLRRNLPEVFG